MLPPAIHETQGLTARNLIFHLLVQHGATLLGGPKADKAQPEDRAALAKWIKLLPNKRVAQRPALPIIPAPYRLALSQDEKDERFLNGGAFLWQGFLDWLLEGRPSWAPPTWSHPAPPKSRALTADEIMGFLNKLGASKIDLQALQALGIHSSFCDDLKAHGKRFKGELLPRKIWSVSRLPNSNSVRV
jgi:hypothetical protein